MAKFRILIDLDLRVCCQYDGVLARGGACIQHLPKLKVVAECQQKVHLYDKLL